MAAETPPSAGGGETPFAGLNPDTVLDALDGVGLRGDGRLIQLNSYENRVFQVFLEDGRVVVTKFYRPGRWSDDQILEEHAFAAELAAAEIPLAACWPLTIDPRSLHAERITLVGPTLACYASPHGGVQRFSVAERRAGRSPELEDPATLEWIGRFVGRIHAVGRRVPFVHRQTLDVETFGWANRRWLIDQQLIAPDLAPAWEQVSTAALERVQEAFDRTAPRLLRLHGDCHPGNILWTGAGPHFVDLDDALNGPAVQDLWMLLSGDRGTMTRQLAAILDGYEDFMEFDWTELRLVEPLRTLRMLHHSAWIARRWNDPAFPIAFPWFASTVYWAEQTTRLREQIEAMAEPPLGSPG
jgi:Ser/Thr protein kinase RdoA (MazF antagonist)